MDRQLTHLDQCELSGYGFHGGGVWCSFFNRPIPPSRILFPIQRTLSPTNYTHIHSHMHVHTHTPTCHENTHTHTHPHTHTHTPVTSRQQADVWLGEDGEGHLPGTEGAGATQ